MPEHSWRDTKKTMTKLGTATSNAWQMEQRCYSRAQSQMHHITKPVKFENLLWNEKRDQSKIKYFLDASS